MKSASLNRRSENIFVEVVVAANLVVAANDAALEDTPKADNRHHAASPPRPTGKSLGRVAIPLSSHFLTWK